MTDLRVSGHTLAEQEVLAEKFTAMVTDELTQVLEMFKALVKYQGLTAAGVPTTPEDVFVHWSATAEGVLADFTKDVYTSGADAIAKKVAASSLVPVGSGVPGLPASYSASYVAKATNKMKNMAPAMWQNIQAELVIGTAKGESIDKLADRVQHAGSVSISRAQLTARTEVVGASNYGSYDQAALLGDDEGVSKQWEATEDMRTRPDHRHADGQIVPLHSTFTVGGYSMLHPGDFTAPASEVCNCRCTIVYVFDDSKAPALCPGGGSDCVTDPGKLPAASAPAPGPTAPHALASPHVPAAPGPTLPPPLSRDEVEKVYQAIPDGTLNDVYKHVSTSINLYDEDLPTAIQQAYNLYATSPGGPKLFVLSDSEVGQVLKLYAENASKDVGWLDDALSKIAPSTTPATVSPAVAALDAATKDKIANVMKILSEKTVTVKDFMNDIAGLRAGFPVANSLSDLDIAQILDEASGTHWADDLKAFTSGTGAPPVAPGFIPSATGHLVALPNTVTSFVKSGIYNQLDWKALDSGNGEELWKAFQAAKDINADAAGLTDLQMARIVDDVDGTGVKAQKAVQDFLNSPDGKKAVDDLAKAKTAPAPPPAASAPVSVPGFGADGDISGIDPSAMSKIKGITLSDSTITSPNKAIWDTVLHIQNTWAGDNLNALQVLRAMDEQFAAYWGQPNAHWYETKMVKWAKTKPGKDYISTAGYTPKWGSVGKIKKPSSFAPPGTPKAAKAAMGKPTPNLNSLPQLTWDLKSATKFDEMPYSEAENWLNTSTHLTTEQRSGLYTYTTHDYQDINGWLREEMPNISPRLRTAAKNSQAGMRPAPRAMTLWRGTGPKQFGLPHGTKIDEMRKLIGKTMQDEGFMSTSVGSSAAFGFNPVLMQIEAPEGSMMAFVDPFSSHPGENEMLLAAGTKYEILDVYPRGSQTVVRMRVIR